MYHKYLISLLETVKHCQCKALKLSADVVVTKGRMQKGFATGQSVWNPKFLWMSNKITT